MENFFFFIFQPKHVVDAQKNHLNEWFFWVPTTNAYIDG